MHVVCERSIEGDIEVHTLICIQRNFYMKFILFLLLVVKLQFNSQFYSMNSQSEPSRLQVLNEKLRGNLISKSQIKTNSIGEEEDIRREKMCKKK